MHLAQLLQSMDLNEHTKIQCLNCHSNITLSKEPSTTTQLGSVCEQCLDRQSNQIASLNHQNQGIEKNIKAYQGQFRKELEEYREHTQSQQEGQEESDWVEQMEKTLKMLEKEQQHLKNEKQQKSKEIVKLIEQDDQINELLDAQTVNLSNQQLSVQTTIQQYFLLCSKVDQLQSRNQHLQRMSILCQLYSIYFDDKTAYINKEAVTYKTSPFLLEILCHLMDKYQYSDFKVNFCDQVIKTKNDALPLKTGSEEQTIVWLNFIAKETVLIWEHIKNQASSKTNQSYEAFTLPFKISLQPQLTIAGVQLTPGNNYGKFLKCFTHNIKIMMNLDLNVELRMRAGKWRKEES